MHTKDRLKHWRWSAKWRGARVLKKHSTVCEFNHLISYCGANTHYKTHILFKIKSSSLALMISWKTTGKTGLFCDLQPLFLRLYIDNTLPHFSIHFIHVKPMQNEFSSSAPDLVVSMIVIGLLCWRGGWSFWLAGYFCNVSLMSLTNEVTDFTLLERLEIRKLYSWPTELHNCLMSIFFLNNKPYVQCCRH